MDLLVSQQLPSTQDLQPFLIVFSIAIKGHNNVRDDTSSMKVWDMDGLVKSKTCCANSSLSMVVEAVLFFKNGGLDEEVLDLLAQCREDKEVRMMMPTATWWSG